MHECVFTDKFLEARGVTTLDVAKRLIDYGFHPPTIYFPLVVHGAIMIEPTESESLENIDQFIATMRLIAQEAEENPTLLKRRPRIPRCGAWTKPRPPASPACGDRRRTHVVIQPERKSRHGAYGGGASMPNRGAL
jgi:hypothetical protein